MKYKSTPITDAIKHLKISQQNEHGFMKFMKYNCSVYSIPEPDKKDKRFLFDYMKKSFSALTFEEITLALNLNLNGKFKHNIEPFNKFSIVFLSKVIEQYRPVRQHELRHNQIDETNVVVTDSEKVHDEFLESCKKLKEVLICNNWGLIFKHLWKIGKVKEDDIEKLMISERNSVCKDYPDFAGDTITEKLVERVKKLICQEYAYQELKSYGVGRCMHDIQP